MRWQFSVISNVFSLICYRAAVTLQDEPSTVKKQKKKQNWVSNKEFQIKKQQFYYVTSRRGQTWLYKD